MQGNTQSLSKVLFIETSWFGINEKIAGPRKEPAILVALTCEFSGE